MPPTSSDRTTLAQDVSFTAKVQSLAAKQAKTIIENARTNPTGELVAGVTWAAAAPCAQRFLADEGFWAGKMALAIVVDPAIDALWTDGTPGSYASFSALPDAWDGPIGTVLPYVFADFTNVV